MNIKYLQKFLSNINEIKIIGKNAEIDGVVCNVAGVARYGMQLRLVVIEYNEEFQRQIEEREMSELCYVRQIPETNRILMRGREDVSQPFRSVKSVFIGDTELMVSGSENQRLNVQDGESILLLSELLRNGWKPDGIDSQNINMLFVTMLELVGEFNKIPDFENNPRLQFTMRKDSVPFLVEKPVTLIVNKEHNEKLWFKNTEDKEEHWAQINSVHLIDMWADREKTFSDPNLLKQMTEEQITKIKRDFEEKLLEICPRGMCYPVVEYECEDCISLQFHTKNYLESKPVHNKNGGIGFIIGTDKKTGVLGLKLKAAIIQEPVPAGTTKIEAELFQYYKTTTPDDIIL